MPALYVDAHEAFVHFLDLPGRDPPYVWLHGLGQSSAALVGVAAHERMRANRSLLVDLIGFGSSDRPTAFAYSLAAHADVVVELLEGLGISRCALIGHSLGGAIAVGVAARRPGLVTALVAAEANLDSGGGSFSQAIVAQSEDEYIEHGFARSVAQMRAEARSHRSVAYASMPAMLQSASPAAVYRTAQSLVELSAPTVRQLLLGLDLPRVFLVGARTLEAEERAPSGEAGDGLDGSAVQVVVVPRAGHQMMFDNAEGFAHAVANALGM